MEDTKETAVTETGETVTSEGESATPEQTASEDTPVEPVTAEETDELSDEEKSTLSVKANKRIRQLAQAKKAAEERANSLEALVNAPASEEPEYPQSLNKLPWGGGEPQPTEVTQEQYEAHLTQRADTMAQIRAAEVERRMQLKSDLKDVQAKHPELDEGSEEYDSELNETLSDMFEKQMRADPTARLTDFVDKVMDLRKTGEEKGKSKVTVAMAKQASESVVTPSAETGPTPERPEELFSDPTRVEEQEAWLKKHGHWE